jgi:hypothetical protein
MSEYRYIEQEIDHLTYPSKLTTPVKRLLAAKFNEIRNTFQKEQVSIQSEKARIGNSKLTQVKDLPKNVQALAKKHTKLKIAAYQAAQAMKALGVETTYDGGYVVKAKQEEITARIIEFDAKLEALRANHDKAMADLQALAKKLADAEVKIVKQRIAKANPALVAELDGIGQAMMPEPPKPVKALKGKTQKAAMNFNEADRYTDETVNPEAGH